MRKVTLTLDTRTVGRLNRLARPRGGNKSFVVREAIRIMSENEALEEYLAEVEAQPEFQASMARALRDIREGKVIPHEEFVRRFDPRRRRRRK